jgi:hypothetical protein
MGGHLLNPAALGEVTGGNLTVSARSCKQNRIWEMQYVVPAENGLVGGLLIGGLDNTWSYGVAGRLGPGFWAGCNLQRTGWQNDSHEYAANAGLAVRTGDFSLGLAGQVPLWSNAPGEVEVTGGWRHGSLGLSAGHLIGGVDPNSWAGISLSLTGVAILSYAADLKRDGTRGLETTSLRVGRSKYLVMARQATGAHEEFSLGAGMVF